MRALGLATCLLSLTTAASSQMQMTNTSGGRPHRRCLLDETPAWLPDGKRIAFQSTRSGVMEVWIMNADGTNARSVTPFHP
jgi:Tol biopolymer transport system component